MPRKIIIPTLVALAFGAGLVVLRFEQQAPAQAEEGPPPAKKERRSYELIQALQQPIDMKEFHQGPMKLRDALALVSDKARAAGREVSILFNPELFKADSPDAPDLLELDVKFPPFPKVLTLAEVLRLALSQAPAKNATFVIRLGHIEVIPYANATLKGLLSQPLAMRFENRPLDEAVRDLADFSGASIVLDARAGEKLKTPVSATFLHDASVWSALYLLTDMAGLKAVVMEDGVYVTTTERAEAFRKDQERKRQQLRQEACPMGLGGMIPPPALPNDSNPLGPQFHRPQQSCPDLPREAAALAPSSVF